MDPRIVLMKSLKTQFYTYEVRNFIFKAFQSCPGLNRSAQVPCIRTGPFSCLGQFQKAPFDNKQLPRDHLPIKTGQCQPSGYRQLYVFSTFFLVAGTLIFPSRTSGLEETVKNAFQKESSSAPCFSHKLYHVAFHLIVALCNECYRLGTHQRWQGRCMFTSQGLSKMLNILNLIQGSHLLGGTASTNLFTSSLCLFLSLQSCHLP